MQTREAFIQSVVDLGRAALDEIKSMPEGAEAAFGDGTFLRLFMELLPILLEILKNWPTGATA